LAHAPLLSFFDELAGKVPVRMTSLDDGGGNFRQHSHWNLLSG